MKKLLSVPATAIIACILFSGCAQNAVKREFLSLLENPGTARGSDLMLVLCGWPAQEMLRPVTVEVDLSPGSGLHDDSGTAGISARNDRFTCGGKIEFTYSAVYMGGHGSGGTDIALGPFEREDSLPPEISDPLQSCVISIGTRIAGHLSEKSVRLPDGSYGDYYALKIVKPDSMIRIRLEGEKGLNPKGCLYQDNKLVSTFISFLFGETPSTFNIISVNKGKVILLVTAIRKTGRYTILIEEPDEAARSMMMPTRRRLGDLR